MFSNNVICYHVYHRSLLVFFSVAKPRSAKLTDQQKKNNGTSVDTWQVQFVPRQNSGSLAYVAGLKRKRLVRRGELKEGVHPFLFFELLPVYACSMHSQSVHKQTGLFDFSNYGHSQLLPVTNLAIYGRNSRS